MWVDYFVLKSLSGLTQGPQQRMSSVEMFDDPYNLSEVSQELDNQTK
jgi:hypothetical protein